VLVGENGAGKSTLAKCILGVYKPDSGQMYLNNEPVSFSDPKDALDHGIAAVYQELTMVPYLNAPQNIFLNLEPEYKFTKIINYKKMEQEAKSFLDILGCQDIDLKTPVVKLMWLLSR
jgi:ribose transport system ATP-binding protein